MTTPGGDFSPDARSAGRRALSRNNALTYLSYAENVPYQSGKGGLRCANNMTDLMQALTILAHRFPDSSEAARLLSTFHDRFAGNALVIDKWFSVQATIPSDARAGAQTDGQSAVQAQQSQPGARAGRHSPSATPPASDARMERATATSLARSSISTHATRSWRRVLTSMRSWRSLEPARAERTRKALTAIAEAPALSTDVRDIVDAPSRGDLQRGRPSRSKPPPMNPEKSALEIG